MKDFFLLKVNHEESDVMQVDTQNYLLSTGNNGVSAEQPPASIDTQNTLTSNTVRLRENIYIS